MKPIPNFPGYFADKQGNIWSKKPYRNYAPIPEYPRKLKPQDNKGYQVVVLYYGKNQYRRTIHRLILETFVGPCPKGMESCHNDGNPSNNKLDNLRWGTKSNNEKDKVKHGTNSVNRGEEHGNSKLTAPDIIEIRILLESGEITQGELGKLYDVNNATISDINVGRIWRHIK